MSVDLDRELRTAFPTAADDDHDVDALWRRGRRRARARTALSVVAGTAAVVSVVAVLSTVARPTPSPVIGELASPTATPTDRVGAFVAPTEADPDRFADAAGGGLVVMARAPIVSGAHITTRLLRIDEEDAQVDDVEQSRFTSSGDLTLPGLETITVGEPGTYDVIHELRACSPRGCTQFDESTATLPLLSGSCRQTIRARRGTLAVIEVSFDGEQPAGCMTEQTTVDDGAFAPMLMHPVVGRSEDEALRLLDRSGLEVEVRYVPGAVDGVVASQSPEEGAPVWPGAEVSSGPLEGFDRVVLHVVDADLPAPTPASNVVGLDVAAAVAALEEDGREASVLQNWLGAAQLGEDGEVLRQRELADGRIELVVARRAE